VLRTVRCAHGLRDFSTAFLREYCLRGYSAQHGSGVPQCASKTRVASRIPSIVHGHTLGPCKTPSQRGLAFKVAEARRDSEVQEAPAEELSKVVLARLGSVAPERKGNAKLSLTHLGSVAPERKEWLLRGKVLGMPEQHKAAEKPRHHAQLRHHAQPRHHAEHPVRQRSKSKLRRRDSSHKLQRDTAASQLREPVPKPAQVASTQAQLHSMWELAQRARIQADAIKAFQQLHRRACQLAHSMFGPDGLLMLFWPLPSHYVLPSGEMAAAAACAHLPPGRTQSWVTKHVSIGAAAAAEAAARINARCAAELAAPQITRLHRLADQSASGRLVGPWEARHVLRGCESHLQRVACPYPDSAALQVRVHGTVLCRGGVRHACGRRERRERRAVQCRCLRTSRRSRRRCGRPKRAWA
jgi:hypothetical protein